MGEQFLAFMGRSRSGKTTLARVAASRRGVAVYHVNAPARELLEGLGVAPTRRNLVMACDFARRLAGEGILGEVAARRGVEVVEGVRLPAEALALRAAGYRLLYVDCPLAVLAERQGGEADIPLEDEAERLRWLADETVRGDQDLAEAI